MTVTERIEADWPLALGLIVFVTALWAQSGALAGVFYDDGIYLSLGKGLALGEGYRHVHLPGSPAGVHYPPVYPFLLGLLWRLWPTFPANLALFELVDSLALAVGSVVIARQTTRWTIPLPVRVVALVAAFTAFPVLAIVGVRFSEPLFLVFFAGALALADRDRIDLTGATGAGILAALATLTRSLGFTAIIGTTLALLLRRKYRLAATCGSVGFLLCLPWIVWVGSNSGEVDPRLATVYGSYADVVGGMGLAGVLRGLDFGVFGPVARLLIPGVPAPLWWPLAALLGITAVWGGIRLFPRARALVLTLTGYALIVTIWPFAPDRFVWVTLPWWFLFLAAGIIDLHSRGSWRRWVGWGLVLAIVVGFVPRQLGSLSSRGFSRAATGISVSFGALIPSVALELPADAVVASGDEALVYLYTGRKSVPASLVHLVGDEFRPLGAEATLAFYCENGVTHVFRSGPGDPVSAVVDELLLRPGDVLTELYALADGPALFALRCAP